MQVNGERQESIQTARVQAEISFNIFFCVGRCCFVFACVFYFPFRLKFSRMLLYRLNFMCNESGEVNRIQSITGGDNDCGGKRH